MEGLKAGWSGQIKFILNTKAKAIWRIINSIFTLVVKVGYDFNWFQVDLSYKNSLNGFIGIM